MTQFALYVTLGVCAGVLAGLFGIGGGIILVPLLVFAAGYSQHSANGTSLVALLLPVGVLGVLSYYRAGRIDATHIKAGLTIGIGIFLGTFFGSKIALGLPEVVLRKVFALFLVVVAVKLWLTK